MVLIKPVLEIKNVSKQFPGVKALSNVNLSIYPGKVHAIVGENGAGKSTLMKIVSGVYSCDSGKVIYKGKEVAIDNPTIAAKMGIAIIHQELSIVPDLTVAENIFLGREQRVAHFFTDKVQMNLKAKKLLENIGAKIDPTAIAKTISAADQQMVEIAKATSQKASVVIMDEPTSSLSDKEVDALFNVINKLKKDNVAVIYISHRLKELFQICDTVSVLRDGVHVKTLPIADMVENDIVKLMVGREIKDYFNKTNRSRRGLILQVEGLSKKGVFKDIDFDLYSGEILGIAGLVGSKRTDVLMSIFGATPTTSGHIILRGKEVNIKSPSEAIKNKIGLLTEDRRLTGVLLNHSVKVNSTLPSIKANAKRKSFLNFTWEKKVTKDHINKLRISTPGIDTKVSTLSGGNQQKVILAKWLIANSDILLLDEPTRGIDVNAKAEIYALMNQYTAEGGTILMVSSELPEILGVCDRILVMSHGKLVGQLAVGEATEQKIMQLASGVNKTDCESMGIE